MNSIAFKPAGDANGVLVAIPEADAQVYVDSSFKTDDPYVIAALDTNPAVVRASTQTTSTPTVEADAPAESTSTPAPKES